MLKNIFILLFVFFGISTTQATENLVKMETISFPNEVYTIEKPLGVGAFSKVFLVRDSKGNKFAMKAYKKAKKSDYCNGYHDENHYEDWCYEDDHEDYSDGYDSDYSDSYDSTYCGSDNFLNVGIEEEFQLGQALNHPAIIKTIDYLIDESLSKDYSGYLIMELAPGDVLKKIPGKALKSAQTLRVTRQLIDALHYGASLDYVYLDLSRKNILIDPLSADLKLVDVASFVSIDKVIDCLEKWWSRVQMLLVSASSSDTSFHKAQALQFFVKNKSVSKKLGKELKKTQGLKFLGKNSPLRGKLLEELQKAQILQLLVMKSQWRENLYKEMRAEKSPEAKRAQCWRIISPCYFAYVSMLVNEIMTKSQLDGLDGIETVQKIGALAIEYLLHPESGTLNDYFDKLEEILEYALVN